MLYSTGERSLPPDNASPWEWLLFHQHQVVSRRQALQFFSGKALERCLSSGKWQTAHRAVYVTHNGPLTAHQRLWVASLAVGGERPALLGGLSALGVLGLRRFTSRATHPDEVAATIRRALLAAGWRP